MKKPETLGSARRAPLAQPFTPPTETSNGQDLSSLRDLELAKRVTKPVLSDRDLQAVTGLHVAIPVRRATTKADHDKQLAGSTILANDLKHRAVAAPRAAPGMREPQEPSPQHTAQSPVIQVGGARSNAVNHEGDLRCAMARCSHVDRGRFHQVGDAFQGTAFAVGSLLLRIRKRPKQERGGRIPVGD